MNLFTADLSELKVRRKGKLKVTKKISYFLLPALITHIYFFVSLNHRKNGKE